LHRAPPTAASDRAERAGLPGFALGVDRPVALHLLGEVELVIGHVEDHQRHAVLGEGAGLVEQITVTEPGSPPPEAAG